MPKKRLSRRKRRERHARSQRLCWHAVRSCDAQISLGRQMLEPIPGHEADEGRALQDDRSAGRVVVRCLLGLAIVAVLLIYSFTR